LPPKSNSYFSTTLEKGLKILSLFNQDRVKCSLVELSQLSGINKTSTYRFVNTLVQLDFLRREEGTKLLKLGPKAVSLGHGFLRGFDLVQMLKPLVDAAHEEHKATVDTALLDGDTMLIIYRREVGNTLPYQLPTVSRRLHCTALGKAILAFKPPEEVESLLSRIPLEGEMLNTITDLEKLHQELALTRERGYSINNEEYVPGLIAIGAPLINVDTKQVVGSVCFDKNLVQMSAARMERQYARAIVSLAREISEVMPIV
jgi:IclR family pca regulon transcriptional regulator